MSLLCTVKLYYHIEYTLQYNIVMCIKITMIMRGIIVVEPVILKSIATNHQMKAL
jgi:hypothetical protein